MNRRGFLTGLLAAPAVITTPGLLMPVRAWAEPVLGNSDFVGVDWAFYPNAPSTVVRFVNCTFKGGVGYVIPAKGGGLGSALNA